MLDVVGVDAVHMGGMTDRKGSSVVVQMRFHSPGFGKLWNNGQHPIVKWDAECGRSFELATARLCSVVTKVQTNLSSYTDKAIQVLLA